MNPADKLDEPVRSVGGRAIATLAQLLKRWRASGLDETSINPKNPPELVLVKTMARETWRLMRREKSGPESVYELIETRPLE